MKTKLRKLIIILFCIYSAFFFIGCILAPVFAHFKYYELSASLSSLYFYSCHQMPDRTFWIFGYPMALCCRCLGFYSGVFLSGIADLYERLHLNFKEFIILLLIAVADIIINYGFGVRHNTGNITRFAVGLTMGLLFVTVLSYLLRRNWNKEDENEN